MQEKLKLSKSQGASTPAEIQRMQNIPYASAVGLIMYAVRCTRPDVAFTQNIASRFQHNTSELHWTTIKNILKYLRNTKDMFLVYGDAEYIAAFDASKEAVWIRKFIYGLGVVPTIEEPINMYYDNTRAIAIAKDHGITKGGQESRIRPPTSSTADAADVYGVLFVLFASSALSPSPHSSCCLSYGLDPFRASEERFSLLKKLKAAELDAALSKSRDSQSSIFFSPENVGLGEGFPSLADLLNASAVQSSAADGLVVADGLLLAIESTLTARVDGLLGDPSMLSPIITSNYIQESHLPDVVSGPGDLLAPSCFNGRSRGLQRDIRAKKKGLQPQGVASVPDNRSSSSNSVLGRKARKPKAMIYTCSLPEVDVEKRALMQGKENRHLAEALGGEGVSLLVYPRLIGNGKPGECYQLPLLPLAPTTLSVEGYPVDLRKGVASLRSPPFRSPQLLNPILNVQLGIHKFTSLSSSNKIVMLVVTSILIAPSKWLQD
ncbi:hypothetical protein Tco_1500617 [Tanacetum coccineum]